MGSGLGERAKGLRREYESNGTFRERWWDGEECER